jgi:hypothetical protein
MIERKRSGEGEQKKTPRQHLEAFLRLEKPGSLRFLAVEEHAVRTQLNQRNFLSASHPEG